MASERLRRSDRLLVSRDFARVARRGRRVASSELVMLVAAAFARDEFERASPIRKIGVTASRKVGNAVVRNRLKRGVREWFRRSRELLPANIDMVVIARPLAAGLSSAELGAQLDGLARRLDRAGAS